MSDQTVSTGPIARAVLIRLGIAVLAVCGFAVLGAGTRGLAVLANSLSHARLHAPDWRLLAASPLAIKIHLATVSTALVLATVQMIGPKGRTAHRVLGWTLAVLLLLTAVTSVFIRNPGAGLLNPFQVFSVWTLISVPWAIISARRHKVRRHASILTGLYFGGMILAGALAFLPGRLLWRVFF